MDYQFKNNLYGQPVAKLSMGHEAIGRWLSDELSDNQQAIQRLIDLIAEIESGHIGFREFNGSELQLTVSLSGVEITPLEDDFLHEHAVLQDNNLYESESLAGCGLSDFREILISWQEFVS